MHFLLEMVHTKIMYNTNVPDYNDSNLYIQPQSSYRIFKSEFEIISLAQFTIIFFLLLVHTLRGFQHYQLWKKLFKPKEKYSIATIICKRATYNFDVVWTKFKCIQCTTEIKSQAKGATVRQSLCHLKNIGEKFTSSSFKIRSNLLHPRSSLPMVYEYHIAVCLFNQINMLWFPQN